MSLSDLPTISGCTVENCSYNHGDNCAAPAITVGKTSACATFIPLTIKGGLDKVVSYVGACQRSDCSHNSMLECTASSIRIAANSTDTADCMTYSAK